MVSKKQLEQNNLILKVPELANEWDYKKNYPLTPENIMYMLIKIKLKKN